AHGLGEGGERTDVKHDYPQAFRRIIEPAARWRKQSYVAYSPVQAGKSRQKLLFGLCCGPWRQIFEFGRLRQAGIAAEQATGFGLRKSGEPRRLEICRAAIGGLDRYRDLI